MGSDEDVTGTSKFTTEPVLDFSKENFPRSLRHSLIGDNTKNTIFVGNLPNNIKIVELKKLFMKFGPIINARLRCAIRKELKIPKKLAIIKKEFHEDSNHINAFIRFNDLESCTAALKMNGFVYEGHHLRVTLASNDVNYDSKKSVFLGNLAFKIQDDDLWKAFEDCGKIQSVRVIRDEKTGIGKGFGYVNFKSSDAVELALKLNGMSILGRDVRVSRVTNDVKHKSISNNRKIKNNIIPIEKSFSPKTEQRAIERKHKLREKSKDKHGFQGQKTKPSIHKKLKKKKNFDKKKMIINQMAEGLSKKK